MLTLLIKKQFTEFFRSYFYNQKKNTARPKATTVGLFLLFFVVLVGILGRAFSILATTLCGPLVDAGMGWLYFLLMGGISVVLGAFGSVFSTYSGLYLAKDNDLLLSMPIPVRTIIAARLITVYLMGALFAATVLIPTLAVHWVTAGATAAGVVCGLLLLLIVTVLVLLLSCLLGWVVARASLRLKNKSFVTVLIAILFIAAYYFAYFRANILIRDLLLHADVYGARIKGAAYVLYLFGRIGEGDWLAAAIFVAGTAVLFALIWTVLSRSFLRIATSGGNTERVRYVEKAVRERSPFGALLGKELARIAASPNYMLNCGLGVLLLPAAGVLLLFKARAFCEAVNGVFSGRPDSAAVLVFAALCMLASMNDMAAPSVSLEGKSLWIPQSLPVASRTVLRAKTAAQLLLSGLPMLVAAVCAALSVPASPAVRLLLFAALLAFTACYAAYSAMIGVRLPLLHWTNELAPIKQSGAVTLVLLGSWGVCIILTSLYLAIGYRLGAALYLLLWTLLFAAAALGMQRWLDTKGAQSFEAL